MHRRLILLVLINLTSLASVRAQGFADWHWDFDRATFTVGPSDSISLTATLSVRPEAPAPLAGRAAITFQGTLFGPYDFDCGFCSDDRLSQVNIPPGGSMRFVFGTLTPKSPLTPGTYRNFPDQPLIDFEELGTRHIPDSTLTIQVVPEPSILTLGLLTTLFVALKTVSPMRRGLSV